MFYTWPFNQDLWTLYHKVTFDGINSLILINDGETSINIERDVYSSWKEWALERDHLKFQAALRNTGGDPTTGSDKLGATFFTINNWQILVGASITFDGNLYSDNFTSPFTELPGFGVARSKFSNLVDKISIDTSDLILAGVATTSDLNSQSTTIQSYIDTQTTTLNTILPSGVVNQLNSTQYDGVPFGDIMNILLSMAQGRIVESSTGIFEFYAQDNATILYTLTKSGNQRSRS